MINELISVVAVIGLISIISGTFLVSSSKKHLRVKYIYPLLVLGGICLEIYSIHIGDLVFIILQGVFILSSIYGWIRLRKHIRSLKK